LVQFGALVPWWQKRMKNLKNDLSNPWLQPGEKTPLCAAQADINYRGFWAKADRKSTSRGLPRQSAEAKSVVIYIV
jgi:hypothetical protein